MEAAKSTVGVLQKQPGLGIKISILAQRILGLQSAIRDLEGQIAELFGKLETKPEGFPVGGTSSLATIISEIGDIRKFPTIKKFLSHLGWCPQTFQTGNYRMAHPKMSHAGDGSMSGESSGCYQLSIRNVPRYREYFERRVKEGKAKMHILVAIGRKLLSALYAILKRGISELGG